MLVLNTVPTAYRPDVAARKAAELQQGDPDWTYTVRHAPDGRGNSVIDIYDEDGEFVAVWGESQ